MKRTIYSIFVAAAAVLTVACSRPRTAKPHPWPAVNDVVDTLSQRLDYAIYHHTDPDSIGMWTDEIERQAQREGDNEELTARAGYYRAMASRMHGDVAASDSMLAALLGSVDSAACPYLYNRVAWHADNSAVRDIAAYERTVSRLKYFRTAGDDFLAGALYTELGNLLNNVRDAEGAIAAYHSADSLYRLSGADDIAVFNSMNLASAYIVMRDTTSAVALLYGLRDNSYVASRPDVEEMVLEKLYDYSADTTALLRLYDMQREHPGAVLLNCMSRYALSRGEYQRASELAEQALDAAIEEGEPDFAAYALYAMSDASAAEGDTVAAFRSLKDAVDLTDEISLANEPDEIAALETMRAISSRRLEAELQRNRATFKYVCVAFVLTLLLVVAGWVVTLRIQRLKMMGRRAASERDSISRRLIATQIARSESEQLITSVGKEIGDMSDAGRIPAGETRRIVNAIKSHAVKQGDRETFIETFSSMHPEFAQRLLELNSAFTEPDIRLATYIAMGMDTKHIADTMGVRPESVKQARWRLRTKLSLEKGASLEQALRNLLG